jgi:hypothetical protein
MNKEDIRAKAAKAKELVEDIDEPFKSIAFEVLFRRLLDQKETTAISSTLIKAGLTAKTVSEFLSSKNCKSMPDQVTAIAYYSFHGGQECITRIELLEAFGKARLPRPKNISDVIGRCIRRGFLVDYPEKKDGQKAWQITPTGEKYVEEHL